MLKLDIRSLVGNLSIRATLALTIRAVHDPTVSFETFLASLFPYFGEKVSISGKFFDSI